jgi:hypothetical protein
MHMRNISNVIPCALRVAHSGALERNRTIIAQKLEIWAAAIAKTCSSPEISLV